MNKEFWKAALIRAVRTIAQTLVGSIPTGFIVTANIIKSLDINVLWAILAWLATGLLAGVVSILTSLATGLPEVYVDSGSITVKAYDDYNEDGSPIVEGGEGDENN